MDLDGFYAGEMAVIFLVYPWIPLKYSAQYDIFEPYKGQAASGVRKGNPKEFEYKDSQPFEVSTTE